MSGLGIEPSFARNDLRGAKAPTNRPDSYEGLCRRPQFYRAESCALIRNEPQAGRGSAFPSLSFCTGEIPDIWRLPGTASAAWCGPGTRSVESLLAEIFVASGVRTPAGVLPRRVPLPTELAGHRRVQPPALRSTLDIIVDPCRFGFSPHFLPDSKIVQFQPLSAHFTAFSRDNTD